ncbi:hypothetical protein O181_091708 [Austropuccinia psidii MF-1]|uniref:Uncharacterized protein n=1 Tax=Austropuccinia psidii MF-1 TaxID=1389203 RepID=A0A9Q3IX75_9BASI|nr:hypothetical protein [Austropuccinia psidii MF-1]
MTSAPPPDHLTPFPFLLSCTNWLLQQLLVISASGQCFVCFTQDMLPIQQSQISNHPSIRFRMPAQSSPPLTMPTLRQFPIDVSALKILPLPHTHLILSAAYHAYAPAAPYRYVSFPATPCPNSTILMLPHTHLIPSAAYHAYAPTVPCRYAPPATPCPHSTILMLPHACLILSAAYHAYAPAAPCRYVSPQPSLRFHAPASFSLLLTMLTLP